jgi:short-subunit dehydrogenase
LTEALADETRGKGVTVSVLAPGPVATGFHAAMGAEGSYYLGVFGRADPDRVARAAVRGFSWGRVLILPGWLDQIYAVALRLLPHTLTVRMMSVLLKRR